MTTKTHPRAPHKAVSVSQMLQEIEARLASLENRAPYTVNERSPWRLAGAAGTGALPKPTMDEVISFRIPAKWKANIEKRLLELGLPERRFADFYRGALMAGIGNALRAKSPAWQAFLAEVEPTAQKMLGSSLSDQGLEGIIRQGTLRSDPLEA